jgi:hypothetical protein
MTPSPPARLSEGKIRYIDFKINTVTTTSTIAQLKTKGNDIHHSLMRIAIKNTQPTISAIHRCFDDYQHGGGAGNRAAKLSNFELL